MKGETSVMFTVNGKAYEFDVSKYTTCDDVIKLAKKSVSSSFEESNRYAVYESAFGVFKSLPGNMKVLKQIRSWGTGSHNFTLEIRKHDEVKSKTVSIARAKKTIQRLRTLTKKREEITGRKLETYINNNIDLIVFNKDKHYAKNITVIDKLFENEKQELSFDVNLPIRTPGDGHENISFLGEERIPGVGEESDNDLNATEDRCTLNCGFISDESESEHFGYNDQLNEGVIYYANDDVSIVNDETVFDDVNSRVIVDELEKNILDRSDENNTINLNECVISEDDDIPLTDDESAFEDDSDCESIIELERNVLENNTILKLNQIKTMFSKGDLNSRICNDDLIDSFMLTFVQNEESDEGMESDCSDLM